MSTILRTKTTRRITRIKTMKNNNGGYYNKNMITIKSDFT